MRPVAVLLDVEGTTTPIAFVRDTLFPFVRDRLPDWLTANANRPEVAAEIAETRRLAPTREPLDTLLGWIDADAKVTPLKTLQGLVWESGYTEGLLKGELYPDVAPHLHAWSDARIRLAIYSSGSVEAQKLLFGHSTAGDLATVFERHFDTRIGAKREAASYDRIAIALGVPTPEVLFLSDVEAELDAAAAAGLRTIQLVRAADGTLASERHPTAADFAAVATQAGLPPA